MLSYFNDVGLPVQQYSFYADSRLTDDLLEALNSCIASETNLLNKDKTESKTTEKC